MGVVNSEDMSTQLKLLAERYLELEKKIYYDEKTELDKQEVFYLKALGDKDVHISNLEALLKNAEQHVGDLEKVIKDKDNHIVNLEALVNDKDVHINNLEDFVRDKSVQFENFNEHINNLENVIRDKNVHIQNLDTLIQNKDVHIDNLEQHNLNLQASINEMQQSASWKMTAPLRRVLAIVRRRK